VKLLVGTRNPGKQAEIGRVLGYLSRSRGVELDLVFPEDLGLDDVPEHGATFEENSIDKARAYFDLTGLPALADDGGLEIDALGGEPGVHSRRWLGRPAEDEELIAYALGRLSGFEGPDARRACLRTCLTYVDGDRTLQECARIEGHIAPRRAERWTRGYPYRALFVVDGLDKFYDELTTEEHHAVNHREAALIRLFERVTSGA
jgi:XTP/dITP diphosphohydrolase